jgi:ribonuclease D
MIYVVTNNSTLQIDSSYKIIDVETSLKLLEPLKIVGLDTETTGLNCHTDVLKSLQLGCFEFQIVIDCLTVEVQHYKNYIESDRLFVGANIKFDLCFLYKNNIWPNNVFDVYLAEKLLWLGYPIVLKPEAWNRISNPRYTKITSDTGEVKKYLLEMNLKKLGEIYLGVELDKSVRGRIIYEGLTDEVIEYSANDVKYLEQLMDAQTKELSKKDLNIAIKYENAFVIPLAYMEYCGIKLDVNK